MFVTHGLQYHSCALSIGGAVSCWGLNTYGQVMLFVLFLRGAVSCFWGRGGEDMYLRLMR